MFTGFKVLFSLSESEKLFYSVHDNKVKPLFIELFDQVRQSNGTEVAVGIKKTVDTKLPRPYSNCAKDISSRTSDLVEEVLQKNETYRRKHCFELCFFHFLNKHAGSVPNPVANFSRDQKLATGFGNSTRPYKK